MARIISITPLVPESQICRGKLPASWICNWVIQPATDKPVAVDAFFRVSIRVWVNFSRCYWLAAGAMIHCPISVSICNFSTQSCKI
ncbi:MAG: hypothetical protein HRU34_10935 [Richelia sp.]|nr:hypothetical protein [Richelia sp.]